MANSAASQKSGGLDNFSLAGVLHDSLVSGVLVVDATERIVSCTPEAATLLGVTAAEISRLTFKMLPVSLQALIRETGPTRQPQLNRTIPVATRERPDQTLQASVVPITTAAAQPDFVVLLNDVTLAQRLNAPLQHLDRLANLGALSAGMTHEVKNALVAVRTFTDLLLEQNRDAELSELVRREMRRIDTLVSQVLKFAGPNRGAFGPMRLHEVLEHSLRMVQYQLDGKLITLNRAFNATPDLIEGDDYQMEQAFLNLFMNALDAMGPSGTLTVATETVAPAKSGGGNQSRGVRVLVSDTGMGIPEKNLNRLFEPFFTTKSNGTGLGLPITRRIIEQHHGSLTVQSEPNRGTTFSLLFPASPPG